MTLSLPDPYIVRPDGSVDAEGVQRNFEQIARDPGAPTLASLVLNKGTGSTNIESASIGPGLYELQGHNGTVGISLRQTLVPPVNGRWSVRAYIIARALDATWVRADVQAHILDATAGGTLLDYHAQPMAGHNAFTWISCTAEAVADVVAGRTYSAIPKFSISSGTWRYFHSSDYLRTVTTFIPT